MCDNEQPTVGRSAAENILNAARQLETEATEYHAKNDPYYWEPEFPDEDVDKIGVFTVIRHNIHYAAMATYNTVANIGFAILDFIGWSGSDYDWIDHELKREKKLEELIKEGDDDEKRVKEMRRQVQKKRRDNAAEKGEL